MNVSNAHALLYLTENIWPCAPEYSRAGERCVHKEGNMMHKSLVMLTLLGGVSGLGLASGSASAQSCNAAVAAQFLTTCPQPVSSFFYDRQGNRHFRGGNDFHENHEFHNGGNDGGRGYGNTGGMGHGGGGGHGR
jgi:hypothetical protein